ncbi:NAD-dependent deacetylase [Chromobacterium violaceum]|uniref:protein acetyllysine N-acetyltransferase n=1 Tax=Chromobacterium violaceum TaxID=536 RepID=A0A3S5DL30_CHRVL|nr:NAD-dependent deacetylase [Chromobacterium violaceum]
MSATERQLQYLRQLVDGARRIAVLTGAGMSTESGIPDFRSADGLWSRDMSLADAVSVDYFRRDPAAFWRAFRDIFHIKLVGDYQPNDGHRFLAALEASARKSPSSPRISTACTAAPAAAACWSCTARC